uniref:Uncharacterized protein n=1 Tax=Pseudomonas aeruginosa TaxID=287 RepID=A0A2L1KEP4_PSEAI|nr:Hypothetical protein [Pseudomonas aeruginosa]AVE20791.1 Hypothetical protein [Pseudomonas aeruginosa]
MLVPERNHGVMELGEAIHYFAAVPTSPDDDNSWRARQP